MSSLAAAPPFLFSLDALSSENVGQPFATGISTGERLLRDRPELHRACIELLKRGAGIREIKRITGLHHRTIEAVRISEGGSIDTARKELGARCLLVAGLGIERLEEVIVDGSIKPGELSMAVGILIDKGQVLTGGVTARVETIQKQEVAAGLESFLDSLPLADAQIVPATGLVGGNVSAIAASERPGDVGGRWDGSPAETATGDKQSPVFDAYNSVDGAAATACATAPPLQSLSLDGLMIPPMPGPSGSDLTSEPSAGGGEGVTAQAGADSHDGSVQLKFYCNAPSPSPSHSGTAHRFASSREPTTKTHHV